MQFKNLFALMFAGLALAVPAPLAQPVADAVALSEKSPRDIGIGLGISIGLDISIFQEYESWAIDYCQENPKPSAEWWSKAELCFSADFLVALRTHNKWTALIYLIVSLHADGQVDYSDYIWGIYKDNTCPAEACGTICANEKYWKWQ